MLVKKLVVVNFNHGLQFSSYFCNHQLLKVDVKVFEQQVDDHGGLQVLLCVYSVSHRVDIYKGVVHVVSSVVDNVGAYSSDQGCFSMKIIRRMQQSSCHKLRLRLAEAVEAEAIVTSSSS
jgi:hypothetical protein